LSRIRQAVKHEPASQTVPYFQLHLTDHGDPKGRHIATHSYYRNCGFESCRRNDVCFPTASETCHPSTTLSIRQHVGERQGRSAAYAQ